MIRTFTAAEVSSVYRVPLGTVYRLASVDEWRRSVDGKWPVLYNGDDVEATMKRLGKGLADDRSLTLTCGEVIMNHSGARLAHE